MSGRQTAALKLPPAMPVRTVVAEVVLGPDRGARWAGECGVIGSAADSDLVLTDPTVSGYHVRLRAEKAGIRVHDFGSTNGTVIGETRIEQGIVAPGARLRLGETAITLAAGEPTSVELHDEDRLGDLRGRSRSMRRLMQDVRRVARNDVAVLLLGESGTGKELVARAIHEHSHRAGRPLVTVDCASLAPSLVASELFGHEAGAFTGATRLKRGVFEHAAGGTVFLDEVGELPPELQKTLLGALERRRFTRVGGHDEISVDMRVVAATNRDLRCEVNSATFRLDLYYRLAVVTLELPPLRERLEDLPLLIDRFLELESCTKPLGDVIPPETLAALLRYRWPGNVRELRNFVLGTLAMGEPVALRDPAASDARDGEPSSTRWETAPYCDARSRAVSEFELRYLRRLLERNDGNVTRAARAAEMARSHLNELLRKHGLR